MTDAELTAEINELRVLVADAIDRAEDLEAILASRAEEAA